MFSAKVKNITGSILKAEVTIEYFDDRKTPWDLVSTQIYTNQDLSTSAKQSTFVSATVHSFLLSLQTSENDAVLKTFIGKVIDSI